VDEADAVHTGGLNRRTLFFRWRNNSSALNTTVEDTPSSPLRQSSSDINNNPASPSRANEEYQSFSRVVLSPLNSQDASAIVEGAHFARHQLAIYTWILYYYKYPITGSLRLIGRALRQQMNCANATTIGAESCGQERIVGDNFLHIHEATMLAHAGLQKADIAFATFEEGFYETPYCIIIDRQWKTIVLSIRGSLTLEDCVVDVLLDPRPLDSSGDQFGFDGAGQYCHCGVFECTQWLYNDLER
jgi:sn1-specific diacylglycerol lipase